jgi:cytoskeleton protein RodZ
MNTIGETLRRERVRQGLDLQTVSETTKIGTRLLKAIEAGEFGKLPGGVFTRSFIKQYASALGVDQGYIENELKELQIEAPESSTSSVIAARPHLHMERSPFGSSLTGPSSRSAASAFVWVLLALAGCGAVYFFTNGSSTRQYPKPETPGEARAPTPKPAEPKPAATLPQAAKREALPSIGNGSLQVVLSASEASWVSISVDGKLLFKGILKPNERREVNAEEKVKVVAGNAGGVDISLNGRNIEALGPRGQVRTVELTRAGAQVVSRAPKAPLL